MIYIFQRGMIFPFFDTIKFVKKTESTMKIEYTIEQWLAIRVIENCQSFICHNNIMIP
jgi:hypothetical protein